VKEVIVEVKEERGEKILVGYVEMEEGKEMKEEEMKERLKERMPEYMVVRRYVKMERMPMQPNGKIDRKALPEPEDIRKKMKEEYVGPRSELEESITEVWKEVLQLDKVGINDNFFDLGGHSISLIELQHKLQEALQKEIIITDLLKYPSVNLFAKYLIGQSGDAKEASQSEQRAAIRRESMKRYRSLRS
jgi:polyketide synthase PksJ